MCNVVGNLSIKDINLDLTYMEIIDLSTEDFKVSPRLRESLRNREIIPFDPSKYPNARRIKNRLQKIEVIKTVTNTTPESGDVKKSLEVISDRMDRIGNKLDLLIDKLSTDRDKFYDSLDNLLNKNIVAKCDSNKLDILINKIDKLIDNGGVFAKNATPTPSVKGGNGKYMEEVPIFIPKLDENSFEKRIKSEEIIAEGTNDILEKLKNLKR